ncbi:hypothetical protein NP233_g2088 [Leucocoprinus birnbaumii]|uniref:Ribosome biogenesis protein NSA1 n=1 Tax=Leucocoprinus birnbaumii TaxID=56174 RepID=A0AAD5YZA3_9AGAR|nr:hypothetical protein NP233_g2088 [Leucocoprinus birnbaumii]
MPRFLVGDEQGQIKSLEYYSEPSGDAAKYKITTLSHQAVQEQKISIQRMALGSDVGGTKAVLSGFSNGTVALSTFQEDDSGERLRTIKEWKDSRSKPGGSYVGLATHEKNVYSCTSNGALQLTTISDLDSESDPAHQRTYLPMRLHDWKLSPDAKTFTYGGDEVELSVWDTEAAFNPRTEDLNNSAAASKKRKRNNELFPGEIWRAKKRDVRRYDTRAARRPVTDWKGVAKVGGVQVVKKGLSEYELFISDQGTNLFSVDLRNGRVIYGYKGLSGAVTSIAPSPGTMASTANDRFTRLHSTFPPPAKEGQNLDCKGSVVEKVYVASVPTVILWDDTAEERQGPASSTEEQGDEVWEDMEQVGESDSEEIQGKGKRRHLS